MSTVSFWMGKFEATFPTDRRYARNHLWAAPSADGLRFGFSAYAVRLLQDVYFLDWSVAAGTDVAERATIGFVESKKAESDLYAPLAGRLLRFNEALLEDPSGVNVDPYGAGWLFELAPTSDAALLAPEAYLRHLESVWEVTQRTIKGQMNE